MEKIHTTFTLADHMRFAQLSRDCNPMHMDAIAARRTQAGAPIVHGAHSLLRLIEGIVASGLFCPKAATLKAQFRNPIYVGEDGTIQISKHTAHSVHAQILVNGVATLVASISSDYNHHTPSMLTSQHEMPEVAVPNIAAELTLEQMRGRTGRIPFAHMLYQVAAIFPLATEYLGRRQVAALMCCSSLVGMVVPGLHSLFAGVDLFLSDNSSVGTDQLQFKVMAVHGRFRLVRMSILGGGLHGSLEAVARLPPMRQSGMAAIRSVVTNEQFSDTTALIVGGSRGLGEVTAKCLAAGGGRVTITYATGRDDATAVANEIRTDGGDCETAAYDVRRPAAAQLAQLAARPPTQLYYFATPPIFSRKAPLCDLGRFAEFNSFYITAFLDLVRTCLSLRPEGISVFYPSSTAVETRPAEMTEYAMSKAAAEVLCADIQEQMPGVRILWRRLPRLRTDQTSSLLQLEQTDPLEIILPILREMHSRAS